MATNRPIPLSRAWLDRRRFLGNTVSGLSAVALTSLLNRDGLLASDRTGIDPSRPYAARASHFPAKANRVLVIFCAGAVSQLETWDYKPELVKRDGQLLEGGPSVTFQGPAGELAKPQYSFKPRGETGKMVSDMIPHLAELTDEFAFVHSLTSISNTHGPAENFLSTGSVLDGFPSLGAWVTYALGSENDNLPAYVAIPDPRGVPQNGSNNWGPGFLPAAFQGTTFSATQPIRNLKASGSTIEEDASTLELLRRINQIGDANYESDDKLAARVASYELAAKMQLSVPNMMNLSDEPEFVLRSYGADSVDNPTKAAFARNCILARRLLESGVRFVQLFNGSYASGGELNWDGTTSSKSNTIVMPTLWINQLPLSIEI